MGISGNKDKQKIGIDQIAKCRLEKNAITELLTCSEELFETKIDKKVDISAHNTTTIYFNIPKLREMSNKHHILWNIVF